MPRRLTRRALGAMLSLVALSACRKPHGLPPPEDIDLERRAQLGILCSATLDLEGRFEQEASQPNDIQGCWPVGTWTIEATPTHSDCESHDILEAEYRFRVTRDDQEDMLYEFLNNPHDENVQMKVSSGGSGECEGSLTKLSGDGKSRVNLVVSQDGSQLKGRGEFERYAEDQR